MICNIPILSVTHDGTVVQMYRYRMTEWPSAVALMVIIQAYRSMPLVTNSLQEILWMWGMTGTVHVQYQYIMKPPVIH